MCMARQRAATGAGEAKALRSAPVMPTKIMSRPAAEPRPISPALPVTPSEKGITAAISVVWSRAIFVVMCSRRNAIEATAVVRCTAWPTIRCRVLRKIRSWATRPQITEQLSETRDSTPAPKFRKSRTVSPPTSTTTGMSSRTAADAAP